MWAEESVFYQIYPLGFCDAPYENNEIEKDRIFKVIDWIAHFKKMNITAIYFSPVFESDTHGYNTKDYKRIDSRLGTNEDFKKVCEALHENEIRIVLDGVFNHAGRGFFAFQDVIKNRENSKYTGWFYLDFQGNSCYNDGFYYEGWEGNYDLVKLNLQNENVIQYLLESVGYWVTEFDIDGIRLDVAYCLDRSFIKKLREYCDKIKEDFFLVGEMIHGDYRELVRGDMLQSATNYECYKGLYSSFNCMNMFEINHSLIRQFGEEGQAIYKGMHLLSFVDNHDVSRIASILNNKEHLPLIYAMLFGMPGIPCIYYGSEWGATGDKKDGDMALRQSYAEPVFNELSEWISQLAYVRENSKALCYGSFRSVFLTNKQCIIERAFEGERVLIAINADEYDFTANYNPGCEHLYDMLFNIEETMSDNQFNMKKYTARFYLCQL